MADQVSITHVAPFIRHHTPFPQDHHWAENILLPCPTRGHQEVMAQSCFDVCIPGILVQPAQSQMPKFLIVDGSGSLEGIWMDSGILRAREGTL